MFKDKWLSTTGIAALLIFLFLSLGGASGCDSSTDPAITSSTSSTSSGAADTKICDKVTYKLACLSIVRRYQYLNDANKYGYFYGFVQGVDRPVIEYVIQGSVFPVSDLVNNPNYQETCNSNGSGACAVVLDKQQPDGTYGTNGSGMFGFTADGAYFEWDGPYAYAEKPLSFTGQKVVGCKAGVPGC